MVDEWRSFTIPAAAAVRRAPEGLTIFLEKLWLTRRLDDQQFVYHAVNRQRHKFNKTYFRQAPEDESPEELSFEEEFADEITFEELQARIEQIKQKQVMF